MRFCSRLTASDADGFTFSIADGNALTITFDEGTEAAVDAAKSPDLVAARAFSATLPLDGDGNRADSGADDRADISFQLSGYAATPEGASAYAVLSVNGKTSVEHFPAESDRDFVQYFTLEAVPTGECHLTIVAIAQRDPAFPDSAATIHLLSVNAQIKPRS